MKMVMMRMIKMKINRRVTGMRSAGGGGGGGGETLIMSMISFAFQPSQSY